MFEKFLTETLKLAPRQVWGVEQMGVYIKKLFTSKTAKAVIACIVAIAEYFGLAVLDTPTTPRGEELDLTGYELVFEDEFEGSQLNTDVWEYRGSGSRRGGFNAPSQVRVENGNMIMTGDYQTDGMYGEGWYTGMVKLKERYCKGYFEIRCIVNSGSGFWSAFWLQADHPYEAEYSKGGPGGCEIDIFESMSWDNTIGKNSVAQTVHCAGVDGVQEGFQSRNLGDFYGKNIYEEYNTYGLEWTDEEYIFYINGVETCRTSFGNGVSEVLEDVIVSLEIPGEEELAKLDKDSYHTEYIVDYVKIYQEKLVPEDTVKEPLMDKLLNSVAEAEQFYFDGVVVEGETLGIENGMPVKVYLSGNSLATEISYGLLKARVINHNGKTYMVFPSVKAYYYLGQDFESDINVDILWETVGLEEMEYEGASTVYVNGQSYTCETYTDSETENRYYFDARQQLKRIEVQTAEGETEIIKVNSYNTSVDDSVFEIPDNYVQLSTDDFNDLMEGV